MIVETAVPDKNPGDIYDEVWYLYTLRETRIRRLMEIAVTAVKNAFR